jgi:hypothetical protein
MVRQIHHKYSLIHAHAISFPSLADSNLILPRLPIDRYDSSHLVSATEKLKAEKAAMFIACSFVGVLRCGKLKDLLMNRLEHIAESNQVLLDT